MLLRFISIFLINNAAKESIDDFSKFAFLKKIAVQMSSQSLGFPLMVIHEPRTLLSVAVHHPGPLSLLPGS